jgi:phenylalanyl-tRNA synthetase alpha chain
MKMSDDLERMSTDALARIGAAPSAAAVDELGRELLGKKSPLVAIRRTLGDLDGDERKTLGQAINAVSETVKAALDERRATLVEGERAERLAAERLDLTERTDRLERGHLHPITQTRDRLEDLFVGMGFTVAEGPEVESEWHAFEALNIPAAHPARSMWDTLYVDLGEPGTTLLRPHTSPVQVRLMEEHAPPIYTVMPGRVYRNETTDATHLAVFHQIEGLVVDRGITFGDLSGTIDAFTKAYFGADVESRLRPSYFPFTEPSAEFDVQRSDGSWLELGGCGMVHPQVLANVGIDPEEFTGFAFGFGIDRLDSVRHGIDDIREYQRNDIRFLQQF